MVVGGEPYRRVSVLYSKIVIIISLVVIVSIVLYVYGVREGSQLVKSTRVPIVPGGISDESRNILLDVDDVITSFQDDVTEDLSAVPSYAVYAFIPENGFERGFHYTNYDNGYEMTLPRGFVFSTSTKGIQFVFPEGQILVSEELNTAIPETWKEVSEYSIDASDAPYVRTYRSGEDDEGITYYTFIQNGTSHVITTSLASESFEDYFSIITSFKRL